jgi:membrane protease YdiL (CAAX protease family)
MSEASRPVATDPSVSRPVGALESLLWTGGYALSQLVAVCLTLAVIAFCGLGWESFSKERMIDLFLDLEIDRSFLVFGVSTLGATLILFPLVKWRLGSAWRQQLQMELPSGRHAVLIVGAVLPLALLSDGIYRVCQGWFGLSSGDTNQIVQSLSFQVSYPILVVAIALGPAVGEELVFRGLIGNGLIQRWGLLRGVGTTAALFALAHVSPAHAIATLPLGVFLHWVYLQTRSLWAPILLHFLNNLLVISLARFQIGELPASPVLMTTAFGCLTAIAWRFGTVESPEGSVSRPLAGPFWKSWQQVYEGWSVLSYTAAFLWAARWI